MVKHFADFRADRSCGVLFFRKLSRWDDDIGIDEFESYERFGGDFLPPHLTDSYRVFITDQDRGLEFANRFQNDFRRRPEANDQRNAFVGKVFGRVKKPLGEKPVVSSLGIGVVVREGENADDGKFQPVRMIDGQVESGVIATSLGPLHPVNDATAFVINGTLVGISDS